MSRCKCACMAQFPARDDRRDDGSPPTPQNPATSREPHPDWKGITIPLIPMNTWKDSTRERVLGHDPKFFGLLLRVKWFAEHFTISTADGFLPLETTLEDIAGIYGPTFDKRSGYPKDMIGSVYSVQLVRKRHDSEGVADNITAREHCVMPDQYPIREWRFEPSRTGDIPQGLRAHMEWRRMNEGRTCLPPDAELSAAGDYRVEDVEFMDGGDDPRDRFGRGRDERDGRDPRDERDAPRRDGRDVRGGRYDERDERDGRSRQPPPPDYDKATGYAYIGGRWQHAPHGVMWSESYREWIAAPPPAAPITDPARQLPAPPPPVPEQCPTSPEHYLVDNNWMHAPHGIRYDSITRSWVPRPPPPVIAPAPKAAGGALAELATPSVIGGAFALFEKAIDRRREEARADVERAKAEALARAEEKKAEALVEAEKIKAAALERAEEIKARVAAETAAKEREDRRREEREKEERERRAEEQRREREEREKAWQREKEERDRTEQRQREDRQREEQRQKEERERYDRQRAEEQRRLDEAMRASREKPAPENPEQFIDRTLRLHEKITGAVGGGGNSESSGIPPAMIAGAVDAFKGVAEKYIESNRNNNAGAVTPPLHAPRPGHFWAWDGVRFLEVPIPRAPAPPPQMVEPAAPVQMSASASVVAPPPVQTAEPAYVQPPAPPTGEPAWGVVETAPIAAPPPAPTTIDFGDDFIPPAAPVMRTPPIVARDNAPQIVETPTAQPTESNDAASVQSPAEPPTP